MLDAALLAACAPQVHPVTMAAVVRVESGGDPLAIHINAPGGGTRRFANVEEAVALAKRLDAAGADYDVGLGQINRRNLPALGLTVEQVLEPCTNLRAAGLILANCYGRAVQALGGEGQAALLSALSCYNTGDLRRGYSNGYLARYVPMIRSAPALAVTLRHATARVAPAPPRAGEPDPWSGFAAPDWGDLIAAR